MLFLALCCSTTCFAAAAAPLKGVKVERDLQYVAGGDRSQSLDLFLPETGGEKPLAVIVWIHGGGWSGGSKSGCPAVGYVKQGYAAASVEYRFSQKAVFPAQIQDCQAAIRWLRANSRTYNIDPDHIGVWGESAGGHLVALLGTAGGKKAFPAIGGNEDQSDRVQAVCDWYGPTDFNTVMAQAAADTNVKSAIKFNTRDDPYSNLIGVHLGADLEKGAAVSPVHYVSTDNAPILIMHGTRDALVPYAQSEEFAEALKKAGVDVILQKFPGAGHTGPAFHLPAARDLMKAFFDKNLKGMDVKVEVQPESAVTVNPSSSMREAKPFDGTPTTWHEGFARYDFVMDEQTLAITPFTAPAGEKFGIGAPATGQRRCVVIVPKSPARGNPWSWRGCYWDHQPQTEVELLRRGFHIAYISADAVLKPGKEWDAWYTFLTEGHGLSKKPAFIGMSRGGEYAYTWATNHPDHVSCIYADNPGGNRPMLTKLSGLADNDVPLLHVCGSLDPILGKYSTAIEGIYQQFGGRISVMIKEGAGHHPHSLRNPKPIADFIVQSVESSSIEPPAFVGRKFARSSFYGIDNSYIEFPDEGTHITCHGPFFTGCYNRYAFELAGVEGTITVIEPKTAAPGKPWVFRAGFVGRDAAVDLALLARGFHIVTGPVPYNADGPVLAGWNAVYKHLTDNGFSRMPVMEGAGAAAGEVYAWAIANPDKVSCIYGENPILHSHMSEASPLENLAPLARAGVPILHRSDARIGVAGPARGR